MKTLEKASRQNKVHSLAQLRTLQKEMAELLFRPLRPNWKSRRTNDDGKSVSKIAAGFIKPNDRLTSFERLEIYNRCYWFRVLDSLYDDFPGLLALLGNRKFLKLATAYLRQYPSESFTLRNLGSRLESFLSEKPEYSSPHQGVSLDMVRFEWAQIVAFDEASRKPISPREIKGKKQGALRFGLQPHLCLLELNHAVDHYLIAVKNQDTDGLRNEASNATNAVPVDHNRRRRLTRPKREKVYLAVHRYDNMLYYKRLECAAFSILRDLGEGRSLESACKKAIKTHDSKNLRPEDFQEKLTEWFSDWSSLGWLTSPRTKKETK